jgi:thioredoxin-like negative regulator of GroEL
VVDEDLYTVPEGYANRYYFRDGWLRQSLELFKNNMEKTQWKRVQKVQELLLIRRYKVTDGSKDQNNRILHMLLSEHGEWPADGEVLRWAATLCRSLELYDEERAFLQRILSLGEDRAVREQLAKLAFNVKDLAEATQHVQALLQSDSNDGLGHWLEGILLMQSQLCTEATMSFRRALQCGYDPRKAGIGLGMAYMGVGKGEEAWEIFDKVMADYPDDYDAMNCLIQSGTFLQRWEDLSQRLARYVERNPANCDMRFALAGVEFRAGRKNSAQHQFEMLKLLKPDYHGLTDLEVLWQQASVDTHAFAT